MIIVRVLSNIWYWVRTHTYNKYHLVDCRSPQNDYKWGWCDRDYLMLCACFNILRGFVEKELLYSLTDYDCDEDSAAVKKEIDALYAWWMTGRQTERRAVFDEAEAIKFSSTTYLIPLEPTHHQIALKILALDERDEEMLNRLIKIRGHLWS